MMAAPAAPGDGSAKKRVPNLFSYNDRKINGILFPKMATLLQAFSFHNQERTGTIYGGDVSRLTGAKQNHESKSCFPPECIDELRRVLLLCDHLYDTLFATKCIIRNPMLDYLSQRVHIEKFCINFLSEQAFKLFEKLDCFSANSTAGSKRDANMKSNITILFQNLVIMVQNNDRIFTGTALEFYRKGRTSADIFTCPYMPPRELLGYT